MITMLAAVTLMTGFTWLCIAKVLGSSEAISGITTLLFALLTVTAIIKRGERINLYGLGEMSLSMLCWIIIAITILLNLRSLPLLASASSVLWAFLFTAIARGKFSRASTLNSAHGSMSRFSDLD